MNRSPEFDAGLTENLPLLHGFALKLVRHKQDAEDLVSETMIKAVMFWKQFEAGTNIRGWLCTIMFNTWKSKMRKVKWEVFDNEAGVDSPSNLAPPDTHVIARDIARSLETLSPYQLEIVKSVLIDGGSYKEAAKNLKRSEKSIKSGLCYARKKMQASINGEVYVR